MTTLTRTLGRPDFAAPRAWWLRALDHLVALDALHRERRDLATLDAHMLRDIGIGSADVAAALRQPERHLMLILDRADQLQH